MQPAEFVVLTEPWLLLPLPTHVFFLRDIDSVAAYLQLL